MKRMVESDETLLELYRTKGDEPSFKELVRRHLGLVHCTALRVTKDHALSEDISQIVFTKLARLGKPLPGDLLLVTWLHRITRLTAIDVLRSDTRRRNREKNAKLLIMPEPSLPEESLSPLLDEVIDQLTQDDRQVVLCRFFQGKSHGEIGRALGLSENAVRMRISRALDKIRLLLQKRGITTTAAALASSLPAYASPSIPQGLAATVAAKALSSSTLSITTLTLGIIHMTNKATITCAALLLIIAGSAVYLIATDKSGSEPDLQPSAETSSMDNPATAQSGKLRDSSGRTERPGSTRNGGFGETPRNLIDDEKQAFESFQSYVLTTKRSMLQDRIQQLAKQLNLTDAQQKALSAWLDGKLAEIEVLDFSDENSMSLLANLGRNLTKAALDEQLRETLSNEQMSTFNGIKEREFQTQVDSMALIKLSMLQNMVGGLDTNQREAVYEVLWRNAESSVSNGINSEDEVLMAEDAFDLRTHSALEAATAKLQAGEDVTEINAELEKSFNQIIDDRLNQLRSILNEEQLSLYRDRLKNHYRDVASIIPANR